MLSRPLPGIVTKFETSASPILLIALLFSVQRSLLECFGDDDINDENEWRKKKILNLKMEIVA